MRLSCRKAVLLWPVVLCAQLTSGWVRGTAPPGADVVITNAAGNTWKLRAGAGGEFAATLPYGPYQIVWNGVPSPLVVRPSEITVCELAAARQCVPAAVLLGGARYPESYSAAGMLLHHQPDAITEPLDFGGLGSEMLPWVSARAYSWTTTSFRLEGLDATDPYQPGRPLVLPDVQALSDVTFRAGPEVGAYVRREPAGWHAALASDTTASPLADWYTREHAEISLPPARRAEFSVSATGQWAGAYHLLFGNAAGRLRTGARSQLDALVSGSRLVRNDLGIPAGIEALVARRMAPPWIPSAGLAEGDHLDFLQAGWTTGWARAGQIEMRYGYSTAHLETQPAPFPAGPSSYIELNGGAQSGPPPLSNLAVRTRHQLALAAEPGNFGLVFGAEAAWSGIRNRFAAPGDRNVMTAGGAPVSILELNTPLDSRARVASYGLYARYGVALTSWWRVEAAARLELARGGLPAQSSPAGAFFPARHFDARHNVIVWNSLAPRIGFSLSPPGFRRLVLRASWSRMVYPLAGRYLDFANPNSLGGLEYGAAGELLRRFGGPYASIDPALRRPYGNEIRARAEVSLPWRLSAHFEGFRRDDKDRLAAVNTGVPDTAFRPVEIPDPGPDFIPGTFDDQRLTVYEQDPATFGRDQFLLTNPPRLRMLYAGILAGVGAGGRRASAWASFMAEKSYGPTNPGNAIWENDPGVAGALFMDPNTLIHAAGRDYFDRAYVGKLQAQAELPGGFETGSVITYLDGQVFGRQLLVTGLAQGPFLVNATVRGSPEGGHRAEYVLQWDLRVSRAITPRLRLRADLFNLLDARHKLVENAFSGPLFNQRLPLSLQPPRFVRLGVSFQF